MRILTSLELRTVEMWVVMVFCMKCGASGDTEVPPSIAEQLNRGGYVEIRCDQCGQMIHVGKQMVMAPHEIAAQMAAEQKKAEQLRAKLTAQRAITQHGGR